MLLADLASLRQTRALAEKTNELGSDTKLHDVLLAFAAARRWSKILCNAMEPGWVATGDPVAVSTGGYFFHERPREPSGAVSDRNLQDRLIDECARLTGVTRPS